MTTSLYQVINIYGFHHRVSIFDYFTRLAVQSLSSTATETMGQILHGCAMFLLVERMEVGKLRESRLV
jgi:hypothetical protein